MSNANRERPPFRPYTVLAVASLLTGVGQVLNGQPSRGLTMAFSGLVLAWVSYNLTTPEHSFVGRYAGGFFIHAIALMDAYKVARLRWEQYHSAARGRHDGSGA